MNSKSRVLESLLGRRIRHAASRLVFQTHSEDEPQDKNSAWSLCMRSHNSIDHCKTFLQNSSELEIQLLEVQKELVALQETNFTTVTPSTVDVTATRNEIVDLYRIVVPILLTACLLSFIFNLLIVYSVRWVRRKLSPTICLSLSLALADAYASLVIGLGLIINSLLPIVYGVDLGPFSLCFILSLEAFRLGGLVVAVLHLLVLAMNHYIGILRPLHYAHIVTRETTMLAIVITWVFPVVFFLVYFSSVPNDGFQSEYCASYNFLLYSPFRVTTSVMFFCPLLLMSIMYCHMFFVVRQHQQGLLQCPSSRSLHKNVKAIITTLLILGTYILGWMPAVLFFVLTCLNCAVPFIQIPLSVRVPVGIFINSMIVAKSFVDPIIYVVRMPEIKCAMKNIWNTRCGRLTEYATPSHSRTDTRRLTFLTSRRKSRMKGKNDCINGNAVHVSEH
ncbi:adrenocorticotropic hormone receptor-like [Stegodyphus dumicola]|uniref:adrenocorticotropic hormone receptor-like n=1 Tax=Stegodyphus dumicola TaxID=202533 RepID=UPI0015B0EE77|nr:adrenocorticotropic hormone receptor-like [Stegodyphus dumicola]